MGAENIQRAIKVERERCARIVMNAIDQSRPVGALDLRTAVALISVQQHSDPRVAAEQYRCARIVDAAACHLQGHQAAAQYALAAIRLSRGSRSTLPTEHLRLRLDD